MAEQRGPEERVIRFKPRTVFVVLGIVVASFIVLYLLWRHVRS